MTKAANGRSSIYKGQDGFWHGWVSFGDTLDGRRQRKHVQATTKREVAEKVARLERQRQSGYVGDRPVTVAEWPDTWIEGKATAAQARTVEGYLLDRRHIVAVMGSVRVDRLTAEHIDRLWRSILARGTSTAVAYLRSESPPCRPRLSSSVEWAMPSSVGGFAATVDSRPMVARRALATMNSGSMAVRTPILVRPKLTHAELLLNDIELAWRSRGSYTATGELEICTVETRDLRRHY